MLLLIFMGLELPYSGAINHCNEMMQKQSEISTLAEKVELYSYTKVLGFKERRWQAKN